MEKKTTKNITQSGIALPRLSRFAIVVAGLVACAAPARNAESRPLRASASGYEVEVLVDGSPAPTFWHDGENYVMGHTGERYVIRVQQPFQPSHRGGGDGRWARCHRRQGR